jgi:hypothetical protein
MPNPTGDQFKMFHGTAGALEGGVVRPNEGLFGKGAYAADEIGEAEEYARNAARQEGRLFGEVYEVESMSDVSAHNYPHDLYGAEPTDTSKKYFKDEQGMKAKGTVSFPPTFEDD